MAELVAWDSFYVIVGSAAGALIGLQFVVITLIAQRPTTPAPEASAAFGTPTIVHFGAALLLSALVRAPWQTIAIPAILWAVVGLSGTIYALNVIRRMRAQGVYEPQFEDWLFHVVLPVAAYAILALSAFAALSHTRESLFGIGAAALLLLFIGIHNAWDAVFYHVFFSRRDNDTRP
jgi:ABC-type transport system involved in multi-copper enzyme maturation permease subunit